MKDIAQDLNVSVVTVSKVLRNQGDISAATRRRVLKRAKELNYQPNLAARSLVTRKSYIIGLIVPDLMHSFFAEVAKGISRTLQPHGYQILISNSEEDPELESKEINLLLARQVDGLILASAQPYGQTEMFRTIEERKVPYVLIDREVPGLKASFVGALDEQIGQMATQHLIDQGCQRIAHIRGPESSTGKGRLAGYRKAMSANGCKVISKYIIEGQHGDSTGYEAMRALLEVNPPPDGVFCYNDPVAAGAMRAIFDAGLDIPRDVAVIGAGNVHYSDLLIVPLSTIDQSSSMMGEKAAQLLLDAIPARRPRKAKEIHITPKLLVRKSSARQPVRKMATAG
jgi:LacI family transcriptional regulator